MDETQVEYNGEFTVDERKKMTAQALRELRKGRKLSQKEVAAHLNIPATTYNTYESGRTEPPIEILVRLSYLYNISVDLIVQRNRTFRGVEDVSRQIAEYKEQMAQVDNLIAESGETNSILIALRDSMEKLADAMSTYSQTEAVQKAISEAVED